MAISSTSCFFTTLFFVLHLLTFTLHVNGCYTSIISFGDSISDTGNLKQIASRSNVTSPCLSSPYGQTFFNEPTGRCSNGRLILDFLAEGLGLPLIPPYMGLKASGNIVGLKHGVNYAVAGAAVLDSSFLEEEEDFDNPRHPSLRVEMEWFKQSLRSFSLATTDFRSTIGRSLILLGEIGGNDYYSLLQLRSKSIDEVRSYVPRVVDTIISTANYLIELGAQTLVVPGNIPLGCSPSYLIVFGSKKEEYDNTTGCIIWLNEFIKSHNTLLQTKLNQLQKFHPNVSIVYADYYNAIMQFYTFPNKFGFINETLKACCGGGGQYNFNLSASCSDSSATVCDQPDTYVSWDGVHLTEAAYKLMYKSLFQGPYTTPRFDSLCSTSTLQVRGRLSSYM